MRSSMISSMHSNPVPEDMLPLIMSSAVTSAVIWSNWISLLIRKKSMPFPSSYMQILPTSEDVRCARNSKKKFRDSYSRSRSRLRSEARLSPERLSVPCVRTYLPNVTVVIFPVRRNFWRNRRKVRSVCAR